MSNIEKVGDMKHADLMEARGSLLDLKFQSLTTKENLKTLSVNLELLKVENLELKREIQELRENRNHIIDRMEKYLRLQLTPSQVQVKNGKS